jgi:UDP-glucose 4-epimerase
VLSTRVPAVDGPRRAGDTAGSYASVDRARVALGWRAELTVADGVRDALAWHDVREEIVGGALLAG